MPVLGQREPADHHTILRATEIGAISPDGAAEEASVTHDEQHQCRASPSANPPDLIFQLPFGLPAFGGSGQIRPPRKR